jgi:prepilin-type N-terminal cleavage/methylation domain-containing protein
MRRERTDRRCGFTLTELAVTTGIVAIAGVLAVADHRHTRPQYILERGAARLATDLGAARMRAISECRPVTVTFNITNGTYAIWADSNANGIVEEAETAVAKLDDEISLLMGNNCTQGVFSARGSFSASVSYWLIKMDAGRADDHRLIYVLPNGQVRCTTHELATKVHMAYGL